MSRFLDLWRAENFGCWERVGVYLSCFSCYEVVWVGDMLESLGLLDPAVWLMLGRSSCGWFVAEQGHGSHREAGGWLWSRFSWYHCHCWSQTLPPSLETVSFWIYWWKNIPAWQEIRICDGHALVPGIWSMPSCYSCTLLKEQSQGLSIHYNVSPSLNALPTLTMSIW